VVNRKWRFSRTERPAEEYRESLAVLHAEAQRLTQIVEDLFHADAGQTRGSTRYRRGDFYLDELVLRIARTRARSLAVREADYAHLRKSQRNCRFARMRPCCGGMILNLLGQRDQVHARRGPRYCFVRAFRR